MHELQTDPQLRGPLPLSRQLDREWVRLRLRRTPLERLRAGRSGDDRLDRWVSTALAGVDDLDDVVALTGRSAGADADQLLHWLLVVGRTEPVAARVVLQRVLPLVVTAASRIAAPGECASTVDDAIVAAAMAIARYRDAEGRGHLAPRLVSAALYEAVKKPRRRRSARVEVAVGSDQGLGRPGPAPELDRTVAAARLVSAGAAVGLSDDLVDLARRLARGESTADIAAVRRCTDRTIRNHRALLAERLRAELGDAWSDWSDPLTGIEFAA